MAYITTKKIFPGNYNEPLNGWYQNVPNVPSTQAPGSLASTAGPTAVLACPGWRYFQFMGYVAITGGSASATTQAQVIVPSPYQNDATRPNITGLVVSGGTDDNRQAYIYRTAVSVPSGWDGRTASGIFTSTATHVLNFGIVATDGTTPTAQSGIPVANASIASNASAFIPVGSEGLSSTPIPHVTGELGIDEVCLEIEGTREFKVQCKATANSTSTTSGLFISDADLAANKIGYIFCEVCYIQQDFAPDYTDLDGYLPNLEQPRGGYSD
jgi:hypothetical protein